MCDLVYPVPSARSPISLEDQSSSMKNPSMAGLSSPVGETVRLCLRSRYFAPRHQFGHYFLCVTVRCLHGGTHLRTWEVTLHPPRNRKWGRGKKVEQ